MPLCTHGCFAHAALFVHQSDPVSKSTVIHFLAGKLNVSREQHAEAILFLATNLNWQVLMHIILLTCTEHRPNGNYVLPDQMLSSYSFTSSLLVIKKGPLKLSNLLILKSNQSHCLGFGYPLLEAINDYL